MCKLSHVRTQGETIRVAPGLANRAGRERYPFSPPELYGCSSAWLERYVWGVEVAGSNPVTRTSLCSVSSAVVALPLHGRCRRFNPVTEYQLIALSFNGKTTDSDSVNLRSSRSKVTYI